jgi:hypothetical protein
MISWWRSWLLAAGVVEKLGLKVNLKQFDLEVFARIHCSQLSLGISIQKVL